jgi:hypothetical protein
MARSNLRLKNAYGVHLTISIRARHLVRSHAELARELAEASAAVSMVARIATAAQNAIGIIPSNAMVAKAQESSRKRSRAICPPICSRLSLSKYISLIAV